MVSACLGTAHPDKSSCWETDEIPDGFCNQAQGSYTDEPEPNTLSLPGQPLASVRYFLGELSPCFKLGCSGPSLPNCRRICSLSFMLSCRFPGAAITGSGLREQEGWAGSLPAPGSPVEEPLQVWEAPRGSLGHWATTWEGYLLH